MPLREVDIVVISDVHLGTYGCKAKELLSYLNSIKPKKIILNGDFIDLWQFSKWYFPKTHINIIKCILRFLSDDIPVYYITGNHDDMLRTFADFRIGNFHLINKLIVELDGNQVWFFHGDFLENVSRNSKWLAKLGTICYHTLLISNWFSNWILAKFSNHRLSFSKRIKASVKGAVKSMNQFEQKIAKIASEKGYSLVICGHSHLAEIKQITTSEGNITYLNSGDWVESLTALEYYNNSWCIYKHNTDTVLITNEDETIANNKIDDKNEYFKSFT